MVPVWSNPTAMDTIRPPMDWTVLRASDAATASHGVMEFRIAVDKALAVYPSAAALRPEDAASVLAAGLTLPSLFRSRREAA